MAAQIEHRIEHQLAGGVVGDLAAAVDPVEGERGISRIEVEMLEAGAAAQGVAGLVLQQQQGLRSIRIIQQASLQPPLPGPAAGEGHRLERFKKNCFRPGGHPLLFLA
jgi:hypothetical protein